MGLPNHMSHASWQACRQVVAGRLVNCYSRKDLILSLMFQYKKFGFKSGKFIEFGNISCKIILQLLLTNFSSLLK